MDVIRTVVEVKQRNPTWGCPRIAAQINLAFGTCINKDVVRRILAHYRRLQMASARPGSASSGHAKDSLHSIDLFRCESVTLRTYWVLVVTDQYMRRIIGFEFMPGWLQGRVLANVQRESWQNLTVAILELALWRQTENREAALEKALADAISECLMHNNEYHHRTPPGKIKSWQALLTKAQPAKP